MPTGSTSPGDDPVEQIKARLNLVDVVQEYVPLRRAGTRMVGLCPFHQEDSPSFGVNPRLQIFKCFGCGQGGDMFEFVERIEKTDFRGALAILAEKAHVELKPDDPRTAQRSDRRKRIVAANRLAAKFYEFVLHSLPAGEPGRKLLAEREVGKETAERFQLGYAPAGRGFAEYVRSRNLSLQDARDAGLIRRDGTDFFQERLVIPIRDERGATVAFTGRTVRPGEPKKYLNSPDTEAYHKGRVVFALDLAREDISQRGSAVLMEGQFDVITAHQFGVGNAVATSGTALTDEQLSLLKRFTEDLVIVFDADKAGRLAAFRAVELAAPKGLRTRIATLNGAKDPDEFLRAAGPDAPASWEEVTRGAVDGWECWIRDSFQGLRWPDDTPVALRRMDEILAKVPDARLRDSYRERAGRWFGFSDSALPSVSPGPRPRPAPAGDARPRRMTASRMLVEALAVRPELAARLTREVPPDLIDESERPTFVKMLEAIGSRGPERWSADLSPFSDAERDLLQRAWVKPPPGVENDEVIAELIGTLNRGDARRRLKGIVDALKAAETRGDQESVVRLYAEGVELERKLSTGRQVGKGD